MKYCARPVVPNKIETDSQPFPQTGPLAERSNQSFSRLLTRVGDELLKRPAYTYIVTSAKAVGGRFRQTGSAPNFQGGRITLCTCKHKDRASPPKEGCHGPNRSDPWQGVWVAGLCSPSAFRPRALFYLMLVEQTCGNHAAAWEVLDSPVKKSAHRDVFGDIYEPRRVPCPHPRKESSYQPHLPAHVHDAKGRVYDIEQSFYGRHPCLLIGDPRHSYLWSQPMVTLNAASDIDWSSAHHRFYSRLSDFFALCQ